MLSAAFAKQAVGSVVSALADVALELRELRRSVDHHAIVTSRPELHGQAHAFYADHHGLVQRG